MRICSAVLFSALMLLASTASSLDFTFEQAGFAEGAIVTGTFSGDDLDLNSQLSFFTGEITAFSMSFSGNSFVAPFSLDFSELTGLVYDLDGGPLGDGLILAIEGIGASGLSALYEAGPGPFDECGIGFDCAVVDDGFDADFSQELITVTLVPEPSSALLIGIGLAGLARARRR